MRAHPQGTRFKRAFVTSFTVSAPAERSVGNCSPAKNKTKTKLNVFLPPNVCMLQVSKVLRPEPSFTRNNRAGATTGTTSSPSYLGLLVSAIHVLGAVQPFSFLLGSALPSRARIEVLWRCFPPKGQSRGDNPFS